MFIYFSFYIYIYRKRKKGNKEENNFVIWHYFLFDKEKVPEKFRQMYLSMLKECF